MAKKCNIVGLALWNKSQKDLKIMAIITAWFTEKYFTNKMNFYQKKNKTKKQQKKKMRKSAFICNSLLDLVPFVQLTKIVKHRWSSVTFSKVAVVRRLQLILNFSEKYFANLFLNLETKLQVFLKTTQGTWTRSNNCKKSKQ